MLIGNRSIFAKLPLRYLAGTTTTTHVQSRSGFGQAGMRRNRFYQDGMTTALKTYSYPQGTYAPSGNQSVGSAYILPQKAGAMASFYEAALKITPNATIYGGITTTATASFTIDFSAAAGQLISSGNGSANFSITTNNPLLTASLSGVGSATFAITTNATIGAKAGANGTANFTITASMTPYAIGSMTGSTVDNTVLTVDLIAAGVLAASTTSPIYADIRKVNNYNVTGNGQTGTEWGPQ